MNVCMDHCSYWGWFAGSHPNQYSSSPVPIATSNTCSWLVRREYVIRSMQVKKDNGFWEKKGEERKKGTTSPPHPHHPADLLLKPIGFWMMPLFLFFSFLCCIVILLSFFSPFTQSHAKSLKNSTPKLSLSLCLSSLFFLVLSLCLSHTKHTDARTHPCLLAFPTRTFF